MARRDQADYAAIKRITPRSSGLRRDQADYAAIKRITRPRCYVGEHDRLQASFSALQVSAC